MAKKCTIKDVAKLAGVSVGTVSMVLNGSDKLNESMKLRVFEAVKKLDYRRNPHARSLSSQKSRTIGLVVTDLTNPFFGMVVGYVQRFINARDYELLLGVTKNDNANEKKVVSKFIDSAVDGLIIVPAHDSNQDTAHIYDLYRRGIPVVFLSTYYKGLPGTCVMTDLAEGSFMLTNYLLEQGHRNILMLSGYRELALSSERILGFIRAHEKFGITVSSEQIIETEPDFEGGQKGLDKIVAGGKLDAITTVNDIVCMGVVSRAKELDIRVPDDLSVAGYDDLLFSKMLETPLTTVRQPVKDMCSKAVDLLFEQIEKGAQEDQFIKLTPQLIIRSSTRQL